MIDEYLRRLREPRYGMVFFSAVLAVLMAAHWAPMYIPGLGVLALSLLRPAVAARPAVWWFMAGLWCAALVVKQDRMEDHVHLFTAWLVALAVCLGSDEAKFVQRAAWHARVLLGTAFLAAVAWKVYFGTFITGTTLWTFILIDHRFQPLAVVLGLDGAGLDQARGELPQVLNGSQPFMRLEAPPTVMWGITVVSVLTLVLEFLIAASHLAPDSHRLAVLRLPSIALFGVMTYGVVPVVPFAALLAIMAMIVGRWKYEIFWVFPLLVIVSAARIVWLYL